MPSAPPRQDRPAAVSRCANSDATAAATMPRGLSHAMNSRSLMVRSDPALLTATTIGRTTNEDQQQGDAHHRTQPRDVGQSDVGCKQNKEHRHQHHGELFLELPQLIEHGGFHVAHDNPDDRGRHDTTLVHQRVAGATQTSTKRQREDVLQVRRGRRVSKRNRRLMSTPPTAPTSAPAARRVGIPSNPIAADSADPASTISRVTTATMAPIGSISTPSASSTVCTLRVTLMRRSRGVTTVGPVTITSEPKIDGKTPGPAEREHNGRVRHPVP